MLAILTSIFILMIISKKRSHKERTGDLWNTRSETQMQIKLYQPSWKDGQHQTPVSSTTNLEEEETVDAPGNDGNA